MSEQTSQEPTMEEILASIRRIISEDDAPAADAKATPPHGDEEPAPAEAPVQAAPEPAPEPEPEPAAAALAPEPAAAAAPQDDEDDDLELTEKVETHGDLDVYTPPVAPTPEPARPAPAAAPAPAESLVSERAASAAASAFERLSASIAMPAQGRTLEDGVRELLKPLLQQWLDDNLPAIVQQAVEAEVERIARSSRVR